MLLAIIALSGSKTLDLIGIASAVLGITGSLYLSYDLLGRRGGFLQHLTMGVPLGLALAGVAYFVSSTIGPAICAHVVCTAGGVPPLLAAPLLFVLGLSEGFTLESPVPTPTVKLPLTLPARVKLVSIMLRYYVGISLIPGAAVAVASLMFQFGFALLQFLVAQGSSASPSAIQLHLPGLGEAVVWFAAAVPAAAVLIPTYSLLLRRVNTLTDRRLGFIGIALIATAFVLQLVAPIVDFASH